MEREAGTVWADGAVTMVEAEAMVMEVEDGTVEDITVEAMVEEAMAADMVEVITEVGETGIVAVAGAVEVGIVAMVEAGEVEALIHSGP